MIHDTLASVVIHQDSTILISDDDGTITDNIHADSRFGYVTYRLQVHSMWFIDHVKAKDLLVLHFEGLDGRRNEYTRM